MPFRWLKTQKSWCEKCKALTATRSPPANCVARRDPDYLKDYGHCLWAVDHVEAKRREKEKRRRGMPTAAEGGSQV
jgi:hypothetical protein